MSFLLWVICDYAPLSPNHFQDIICRYLIGLLHIMLIPRIGFRRHCFSLFLSSPINKHSCGLFLHTCCIPRWGGDFRVNFDVTDRSWITCHGFIRYGTQLMSSTTHTVVMCVVMLMTGHGLYLFRVRTCHVQGYVRSYVTNNAYDVL